jgi:predicted MFS family arabinose efflux permease
MADGHHDDATPGEKPGGAPAKIPGAGLALSLLLLINLFNYIDRFVLAAVEPDIRESLLLAADPEDPNVKAKMGLLSTAFMVSYMLTAPVFGWLAGLTSRWLLIAVGVALWSLASGASGLAAGFSVLLATRCFVGVGEGAYGPVAPTVLSDFYPVAQRGRVLALFYVAIPVGSALGYVLGGTIAGLDRQAQSWRWAFYVVVVPGLLLALWSVLMREPQRGAADRADMPSRRAGLRDYLHLLRIPSYVLNTLGMTAMTFAIGALAYWMPAYLKEHEAPPLLGFEPVPLFGAITALAGLTATIAGGLAGDALRERIPGSYFLVSGVGLCLGVPCAILFLVVPFPAAWLFVFLAEFFVFFNTGPSNTILANVTHPAIRATGFALNILVIHILGDAISPFLIGAIADRSSLAVGFLVVSLFMFLGGIIWLFGMRHLEPDTAAARHQLATDH